jgi:hypothetical protein
LPGGVDNLVGVLVRKNPIVRSSGGDQVKLPITSNKHVAQKAEAVFPGDLKGTWHQPEHMVASDCHIDHRTDQQLANRCKQQQVMLSKSDTRSKQVILPCKSFEKLSDDVKPIVQGPHSP